jgi:hypothetical protein
LLIIKITSRLDVVAMPVILATQEAEGGSQFKESPGKSSQDPISISKSWAWWHHPCGKYEQEG